MSAVCGCLGCHEPATVTVDHPDHGERTVCDDCAEGFRVLGLVE